MHPHTPDSRQASESAATRLLNSDFNRLSAAGRERYRLTDPLAYKLANTTSTTHDRPKRTRLHGSASVSALAPRESMV